VYCAEFSLCTTHPQQQLAVALHHRGATIAEKVAEFFCDSGEQVVESWLRRLSNLAANLITIVGPYEGEKIVGALYSKD
jgi:hypothetical protein